MSTTSLNSKRWETIKRPGYFGKKRDKIYAEYDEEHGKGNWRIAWQRKEDVVPFEVVCLIYENAYFADSLRREDLWKKLVSKAKNVYDIEERDIESGLDYTIQKGPATHIQDIAIRRVVLRRGLEFQGKKLVQIRSHKSYWGKNLSPGRVPFHRPELIVEPHLEGWWDDNSVECFYQSNKILQIRK